MSPLIRRFFMVALFALFLWETTADEGFGQYLIKDPKTGKPLPMWEVDAYGPFGPRALGGYMEPTYPNSRFQGSGVTFDKNGEFLGFDSSAPNARFQHYWKQEPFNTLDYFPNRTAQRIGPSPEIAARTINPSLRADFAGPQMRLVPRPGSSMLSIEPGRPSEILQRPGSATGERWFRDRPGENPAVSPGEVHGTVPGGDPVGPARPVGGDAFRPQPVPAPQTAGQQVPQAALNQSRIRMIEGQLEEALIRSAVVHPLSPIEVVISNGTATVRGVVPNQAAKTEAETILLGNPAVNAVNNRLSVLNEEPGR